MRSRALIVALACLSLTTCRGIGDALRLYGYTEIRPPSRLFAPGTLVWVEGTKPFKAGVICTPSKTLGRNFIPMASRTMDSELAKVNKRGVTLKADVNALAHAGVDVHAIKQLTMTLKNARIVEVDDYTVATRRESGDATCADLAAARRKAGYAVTMISSALQADVTYAVKWDRSAKMDANARVAALQGLAAGLGVEGASIGDNSLSATGLYWGIRDSAYLSALFVADAMHRPSRESRILSLQTVPQVVRQEDATRPLSPISEAKEPAPEPHTDEEWETLADATAEYGAPPGKGRAQTRYGEQAQPAQAMDAFDTADTDSEPPSPDRRSFTPDDEVDPHELPDDPPSKRESTPPRRDSLPQGKLPLERPGSQVGQGRVRPAMRRR